MVEHAHASAVRRFLTAWFRGDAESWRPLAADDVVIHLRRAPAAEGAPTRVDIDDVFADERFAVAIVKVAYERPTGSVELSYACAQRIDADGKVCEMWNLSDSRATEDELFG